MNDDNGENRGGENRREEFGASERNAIVETSSSAVAAQAEASVKARFVMALQKPRDWDVVRSKLLKECQRPGFADSAIYHKPIGDGVEGPSIRFAEAALRCMGNALPETTTIYDDDAKRILRVTVTDLESNLTYSRDVTIEKTVERKKLGKEQQALRSRFNSYGDRVYIVRGTDDDILNKENALVSKALRTLALRVLPGDILDECMDVCRKVQADKTAQDPDAARKKLFDSFGSIGVDPGQIKVYLGHELSISSPAEIDKLRAIYFAIRDGEATWAEVMESVAKGEDSKDQAAAKSKNLQDKLDAIKNAKTARKNVGPDAKPAAEAGATERCPECGSTGDCTAECSLQGTAPAAPAPSGRKGK